MPTPGLAEDAKLAFYHHQRLVSHVWNIGFQFLLIFGALLFESVVLSFCAESSINQQILSFSYPLEAAIGCAALWLIIEHITQALSQQIVGQALSNFIQWAVIAALANLINVVLLKVGPAGSTNSILVSLGLIIVVLILMAGIHYAMSSVRDLQTAVAHRGAAIYNHSRVVSDADLADLIRQEKDEYNDRNGVVEILGLPLVSQNSLLSPPPARPSYVLLNSR